MNRYEWHYLPATIAFRYGIAVKELNITQKQRLYITISSFRKEGYTRTKSIMDFGYLLKELNRII